MTANTVALIDEHDAATAALCWACSQAFTVDEWADRHGPGASDPDHVEYHAHCCPTCHGEVTS